MPFARSESTLHPISRLASPDRSQKATVLPSAISVFWMRQSCSLLSHSVSIELRVLPSAALILNTSTDTEQESTEPVFARRHANGRRQERLAEQSRCHHAQFCLLRLQPTRPRFWDAGPHRLQISTKLMGGPATVGLTKLWRKATERVPVPCRMVSPPGQSSFASGGTRWHCSCGVEQRNPTMEEAGRLGHWLLLVASVETMVRSSTSARCI